MQFRDQIAFIVQHISKSKLRIFMTVLATTIGTAFLIILASVAFGFEKTLEDEFLTDPNLTKVSFWNDGQQSAETIQQIKDADHVYAVIEQASIAAEIDANFGNRQGYFYGTAYDMKELAKISSNLQLGRLPEKANEIVVGYDVAASLLTKEEKEAYERSISEADGKEVALDHKPDGYKESLLEKELSITIKGHEEETILDQTFIVVGVKEDSPYEYAFDNEIVFHLDVKNQFLDQDRYLYSEHVVHVDKMDNVLAVIKDLKAKGIQVYSPLEQMEQMNMIFVAIKAGLIFIGAIAVIIASIGIFNTMTMAVTERTREIGILKAIGATPKLIKRLFLMESLFIGLIGTAIAVVISYAVSFSVNLLAPIIFEQFFSNGEKITFEFTFSLITPSLLIIATAISLTVALLSGYRPAKKATEIEVVKALQQL